MQTSQAGDGTHTVVLTDIAMAYHIPVHLISFLVSSCTTESLPLHCFSYAVGFLPCTPNSEPVMP